MAIEERIEKQFWHPDMENITAELVIAALVDPINQFWEAPEIGIGRVGEMYFNTHDEAVDYIKEMVNRNLLLAQQNVMRANCLH